MEPQAQQDSQTKGQTYSTNQTTKTSASAPNPQARVIKYLGKLYSSPQYKSGSEEYRKTVREAAYNKHLVPFWQKHGITPPDKDSFISGTTKPVKQEGPGFITKASVSALNEAQRIGTVAQKGIEKVSKVVGGVYQAPGDVPLTELPKWWKDYSDAFERGLKTAQVSHYRTEEGTRISEEWMGDNINDSLKDQTAKMSGQLLADLPLFIGAGKVVQGAGKVLGAARSVPALDTVFKALLKYPKSIEAIKEASEGYLVSRGTGHTNLEATSEGGQWAAIGTGGRLIKKPIGMLTRVLFSKVAQEGGPEIIKAGVDEALQVVEHKKAFDPNHPMAAYTEAIADTLNQKAKDAGHKNFYIAPRAAKVKILQELGYEASQAINQGAAFNKRKVEQVISEDLKEAAKDNPVLTENLASVAAITKKWGVDPVKQTASYVTEKAKKETGIKSKRAIARKISEDEKAIDVKVSQARAAWLEKKRGVMAAEPGYSEQTGVKPEPREKSVGAASASQVRPLGRPLKQLGAQPIERVPLPENLRGARPKFGYGKSQFEISFEGNDLNRALYIIASAGSKQHEAYYQWVKGLTGWPDNAIKNAARNTRAHIKNVVKSLVEQGQTEGTAKIFRTFDPLEVTEHTQALKEGAQAKRFDTVEKIKENLKNHPEAKDAVQKVDDTIKKIEVNKKGKK